MTNGADGLIGLYLQTSNPAAATPDIMYVDFYDRTTPVTAATFNLGNSWTGRYHTWVIHANRSSTSNVTLEIYMDGVLKKSITGGYFPGSSQALMLTAMDIGSNINHGPGAAQSRWFGNIGIYYSQPSLQ